LQRHLFSLFVALTVAACARARAAPEPPRESEAGNTCTAARACAEGSYCAFSPGLCGKGKRAGMCKERPRACTDERAPVCGCDGHVYESACDASAHGVDLAANGGCGAKVAGWVACGPRYCDARVSYCEIVLSDVFELPTDYTCKPLPQACAPAGGAAASCDCFPEGTRCRSFCGHVATGGAEGFHLTCRL
jgi:hypothetical protein